MKTSARIWAGIAGLSLIAGFFMPWIDVGGPFSVSGFQIVRGLDGSWSIFRLVMALVPVIGAAMAFTAFTGSRYAKHASLAAGVGILGYGAYKTISTFVATTGWGLWLVIGSALVALFAGLAMKTKER